MAKWKGITADELIILREIQKINFQMRSAAKEFGMNSRLYQQYESMLFPRSGTGLGSGRMHRHMKSGVVQLRTDKAAIQQYVLGSYKRDLKQLGQMQTVGQTKQNMLEAYQARNPKVDPESLKTRAGRAAAIEEEKKYDQGLFDEVSQFLDLYYKLEDKLLSTGGEFTSHQRLREISKGHWSSYDELRQMLDIAKKELEAEQHNVVQNFLERL